MQKAIDETNYRREKQTQYNLEHNKVPTPLNKKISEKFSGRSKRFQILNTRRKKLFVKLQKNEKLTEA